MENKLSGIERELVLKYLLDGNVPVTITPLDEKTDDHEEIHNLESEVVPILISPENISVLKEGIILLQKVKTVNKFVGKKVKVEFYFNHVGLYFVSELKAVSSGPALVIPVSIFRIPNVPIVHNYNFSAVLYYTLDKANHNYFPCYPAYGFELFTRPVWSSIELKKQKEAKKYLEKFVVKAHDNGRAGNGIQLIPICHYLVQEKTYRVEAFENSLKPFEVIFVNHERIVLAYEQNEFIKINEDNEYAVKMSFSLTNTPTITRDIFVTARVDAIYTDKKESRICCDMSFTTLQEEDLRFLYEKTTSTLLN